MKTPVVFLIFNRPDTTEKVFKAIRQARPPKLLVVADGPRIDRLGEAEKCAAARAIIEHVDWDCEVLKNYSDVNLGCSKRVSSGLDWVFNTVEEAIILEDDCVPHSTFFGFCEELLERYRHDERIMSICGVNVQFGRKQTEYSYYFSHHYHPWGWATWKRAWRHYDVQMKLWPEIQNGGLLKDILVDSRAISYWTKIFQASYDDHINAWSYPWVFACWIQSGLTILPNVNLVANIGFGVEATHTVNPSETSQYANMAVEAVTFPLKHPPFMIPNIEADNFTQNTLWAPSLFTRAKAKVKRISKKLAEPMKYKVTQKQRHEISVKD